MKRILRALTAIILAICLLIPAVPAARVQAADSFTPRYSCPGYDNPYYFSSMNIFYACGYGMPNCTAYAWGRVYEIRGSMPALSTGNAGEWWFYNKRNGIYNYGSTPRLGAVACWDRWDEENGHVAVVESINGDGTVTLSESNWGGTMFENIRMSADGSDYMTSYRFLGYIYAVPSAAASTSSASTQAARNYLMLGDRGDKVTELQQLLNKYGYSCGPADGYFGNQTDQALRLFQRTNGLVVDGYAGNQTLTALRNGNCVYYSPAPAAPKTEEKKPEPAAKPAQTTTVSQQAVTKSGSPAVKAQPAAAEPAVKHAEPMPIISIPKVDIKPLAAVQARIDAMESVEAPEMTDGGAIIGGDRTLPVIQATTIPGYWLKSRSNYSISVLKEVMKTLHMDPGMLSRHLPIPKPENTGIFFSAGMDAGYVILN